MRAGFGIRDSRFALPLLTGTAFVFLWWLAVRATHTTIFPSPADVGRAILSLSRKSLLWSYIGDSLLRVGVGYFAGVILGVPIGMFFGWYRTLERAANPVVQMLRPISPLAWMPLTVIWFGVSNAAPMFLIFVGVLFPVIVASANAVRNVPPMFLRAGRNFGLTAPQLLRRVVLPAAAPQILSSLRIAFGVAWIVLVASEMIAVDSGLGYLIIDARNAGKRYDLVVAGMLMIGIIGLILDSIFRVLTKERRWSSA